MTTKTDNAYCGLIWNLLEKQVYDWDKESRQNAYAKYWQRLPTDQARKDHETNHYASCKDIQQKINELVNQGILHRCFQPAELARQNRRSLLSRAKSLMTAEIQKPKNLPN